MSCAKKIATLPRTLTGCGGGVTGNRWYALVTIDDLQQLVSWHYRDMNDEQIHHIFLTGDMVNALCVDHEGNAYCIVQNGTTIDIRKIIIETDTMTTLTTYTDKNTGPPVPFIGGQNYFIDSGLVQLYWHPITDLLYVLHSYGDYYTTSDFLGVFNNTNEQYIELSSIDKNTGTIISLHRKDFVLVSGPKGLPYALKEMQLCGTPDGAVWGTLQGYGFPMEPGSFGFMFRYEAVVGWDDTRLLNYPSLGVPETLVGCADNFVRGPGLKYHYDADNPVPITVFGGGADTGGIWITPPSNGDTVLTNLIYDINTCDDIEGSTDYFHNNDSEDITIDNAIETMDAYAHPATRDWVYVHWTRIGTGDGYPNREVWRLTTEAQVHVVYPLKSNALIRTEFVSTDEDEVGGVGG